jgi:hypothetical protein
MMTDVSGAGLGFGRYSQPLSAFDLPLRLVATLPRDGGSGDATPLQYVVSRERVIVARHRVITIHSADLRTEVWRRDVGVNDGIALAGGTLVVNEQRDQQRPGLRLLDVHGAGDECFLDSAVKGNLRAITRSGDVLLLQDSEAGRLMGVRVPSGAAAWTIDANAFNVVGVENGFVLADVDGREVQLLDSTSGASRWRIDVSAVIGGEEPVHASLTVVPDAVLIETHGWWLRVSVETGTIVARAPRRVTWPYTVTSAQIIASGPEGLLVTDHRSFETLEEREWREDVAGLYGDEMVVASGVAASDSAILWTTPFGRLIGVPRRAGNPIGAWSDVIRGARFSKGQPILSSARHVYVAPLRLQGATPPALCCYASSSVRLSS